jgi:26S proteasome regulatory subunit N2
LIEQGKAADVKLTAVVERMFQRCLNDKEFKQAIGIGLESRRLDFVEQAIVAGQCSEDLLKYTLEASTTVVEHLDFRNKILQILVKLFKSLKQPDYITIGACLVWLNDPNSMADMLLNLVSGDQTHKLIAYQIAFDSYSNATQEFLLKVLAALPKATPSEAASAMEVDGKPAEATTSGGNTTEKLRDILSGNISIKLNLEFLYRNNKADQLILKNTKVCMYSLYISF